MYKARNFKVVELEEKQDGNPYNGPSAIMVKVKPVGQDGQDWQNGLVGQNCYSQAWTTGAQDRTLLAKISKSETIRDIKN